MSLVRVVDPQTAAGKAGSDMDVITCIPGDNLTTHGQRSSAVIEPELYGVARLANK